MRWVATCLVLLVSFGAPTGCADDTGAGGSAGNGGTSGTGFATFVRFANVVVGAGDESTDIGVDVNGVRVEDQVAYQTSGSRHNVEMPSQVAEIPAEMFLTESLRVLNPDGSIALRAGPPFTVYAIGNIDVFEPPLAPAFLVQETLAQPESGTFRARAIHALVGSPDAVDVYANGAMFGGVAYGTGSGTLDVAAGAPDTDSLVVTEAGVPPNEATDLYRVSGATLFAADRRYDLVVSHQAQGGSGISTGAVTVWIAEIEGED